MASNDSYYTFLFHDQSGDVYGGYGYADVTDGYTQDQVIATSYGYYQITGVTNLDTDLGYQGYVEVAYYLDAQTNLWSQSVNAYGVVGLGNEWGTVTGSNGVTDDFGGGGQNDADFGTAVNDTYYTFTFYDWSGDIYGGYGYADVTDGYTLGKTIDTGYGHYVITGVANLDTDLGYQDYVEVTFYHDAQTDLWAQSVAAYGFVGLGNEAGSATGSNGVSDDFGGGGRNDADFRGPANDSYYTFTFYDQSGDIYGGYGYADVTDGLAPGQQIDTSFGHYVITGVTNLEVDLGYQGYVETTFYYDAQTGVWAQSMSAYGFVGLGNEAGTATGSNGVTDHFGRGGQEDASFREVPANTDVHYTFHFHHDGGDYYFGHGVADFSAGYYDGLVIDDVAGYYVIDATYQLDGDYHEEGTVTVDYYYDADSGMGATTSVSGDYDGLGNEYGWAEAPNGDTAPFGHGGYYEADFDTANLDYSDVRYEFTFTYDSGDWYSGWGYADAWQGYAVGTELDETAGTYRITAVAQTGSDGNHQGYVEVTDYYDSETGQHATPVAAGDFGGLGWEFGSATIAGGESDSFGLWGMHEADFPGPAGTWDVYYEFTFWYPDGDYYYGTGIADAAADLSAGDRIDTGYGIYTIDYVENRGADHGEEGTIGVDYYFDADSGRGGSTTVHGLYGDLGEEFGTANGYNGYSDTFGLGGYYEADLTGSSPGTGVFDVRYEFTFHYDSGDFYSGYGYADQWEGIADGSRIDTDHGYYLIGTVTDQGADNSLEGYIEVESYYDFDTGQTGTTDAAGYFGALGWEAGFAFGAGDVSDDFGFGGVFEADLGAGTGTSSEDVYYRFSFSDDGGDLYYGWGYTDAGTGYQAGDYLFTNYGYYLIEYVEATGRDNGQEGYLEVNYYYDADTGISAYTNVAGYFDGLGTEFGNAFADSGDTDGFGYGGLYDADFF